MFIRNCVVRTDHCTSRTEAEIDGVVRARTVEGRTRSSAAARGEARAPVSRRRADAQGKTNRRRREEEERKAAVFDEEEEEGIDLC